MAIEKLNRKESPVIDKIPAKFIKAGVEKFALRSIKLINSIRNSEDLPEELKDSIILSMYKKDHRRDCSNYRGLSLMSTM